MFHKPGPKKCIIFVFYFMIFSIFIFWLGILRYTYIEQVSPILRIENLEEELFYSTALISPGLWNLRRFLSIIFKC